MEENINAGKAVAANKLVLVAAFLLAIIIVVSIPVYAWLVAHKSLASYVPVSSPESLYIGAGHIEFEDGTYYGQIAEKDQFEDIRYMYLSGIDATSGRSHYDYVFCVYGNSVASYKLQIEYTTNNQFSYEIYPAVEALAPTDSESIAYTTHGETPATYYYDIDGDDPLEGSYLNQISSNGEILADGSKHTVTYGTYGNVDKYAEPIYWQMAHAAEGDARGNFVTYYILRVIINEKSLNDKETDVICIAAKTAS